MVNDVRLIDANSVVKDILWVRDNDLHTGYPRSYEQSAIRKALRCVEEATTIEAIPVAHERCKYCRGVTYTDKPFKVITQLGKEVEVQFNYCPNCGAKI